MNLDHATTWPAASGLDLRGVHELLEHDTGVVIATSGSSGVPKRVAVSAAALRASATATAEVVGEGRWVLALPTDYVAGLQVLVRSALADTEPVTVEGGFTADGFVAATRAAGARHPLLISLVPAQVATLVDAAERDVGVADAVRAYRAYLIGGQAMPVPLRERAAALGMRIVRTYGSSETSGGCVYDGRALPGVRVVAVDGELRITGPVLADGYLGDADLTARNFVRDSTGTRWYRTGDLGTVTDGIVAVTGRADNVIISGGINVSLDRVERVVRGVPGLASAVVVGVDDARWGEASVIVARRIDDALDEHELLEDARRAVVADLGRHARPSRLIFVDELPVLASGKPDRAACRRLALGQR